MSDTTRRPEIPCLLTADIELPAEVETLYDLAYNLWWSWTPEARHLFSSIDALSWGRYRNPVELLLNVDHHHWEALVGSDTFMEAYGSVRRAFEGYLHSAADSWFGRHYPQGWEGPIAYFSMEYGLHQSLAIYSGGLGVLSGDHCKSASDLGLPFVGVGLLYRFGYFRQTIDADGFQQHTYPEYDFHRLPLRPVAGPRGGELVVRVPFPDREVSAKVWLVRIGRVPLLLLDTDILENDPADRPITNVLYVRGREMRLAQEMVLGVGGTKALAALGIEPSVWHINEGHSSLLQLERLRQAVDRDNLPLEEALDGIGANVAFTTHTPVPAGNERFERRLVAPYVDLWAAALETEPERLFELGDADSEPGQGEAAALNLTALALRTSERANAVSQRNAEVCDGMWRHLFPELPPHEPCIRPITNGIHVPTWIGLEMRSLLARALGAGWLDALLKPEASRALLELEEDEVWAAHQGQKDRLIRFVRARLREQAARHGRAPGELRQISKLFDPEALTISFARRFATYKRANLVFSDLERLRGLLADAERPVQILFAGKAHPADRPGQELIQQIFQLSQEGELSGRVAFIENYDMRVGRMLVQGVDVWLNTPRRPYEASGTSGMKAAVNGVLNLSVLDGWWPEAFDGGNGWAIGSEENGGDEARRDREDAESLYSLLEQEVVPTFYERGAAGRPERWMGMMKRSIATVAPRFSSSRMVRDYVETAYAPLARRPVGAGAA